MYPLAVRADPGGTVGNAPFIFRKTLWTYFKATGTAPAEGLALFAAVAGVPFFSTPAAWFFLGLSHTITLASILRPASQDTRCYRTVLEWPGFPEYHKDDGQGYTAQVSGRVEQMIS